MVLGLMASFISGLFGWLMGLLSLFLILLVLVQRGRGGGLTGALGGPGGQSAFGSKAGDMFTRVTFVVAGVWILLCALAMWSLGNARSVVAVPPQGVIGETNERGGGVVPPTENPQGAAPDLSGLGDLSDLLNQPTGDAPATESPATETPATETPATETPATETPATETPATETPAADSEPAGETPAAESEPAAENPPADPS